MSRSWAVSSFTFSDCDAWNVGDYIYCENAKTWYQKDASDSFTALDTWPMQPPTAEGSENPSMVAIECSLRDISSSLSTINGGDLSNVAEELRQIRMLLTEKVEKRKSFVESFSLLGDK